MTKVIRSGKLMRDFGGTGSWCERFEAALAEKVGVKYAVTTCSGTSALIGALLGRFLFAKWFGKKWPQYRIVFNAGFVAGIGLITMISLGFVLMSKSVIKLVF